MYIPDIILTTLPVQFQPFQKPELPYKGHAQDNIIGYQSIYRTPCGVQGGHKDLLKIFASTETDAAAPKRPEALVTKLMSAAGWNVTRAVNRACGNLVLPDGPQIGNLPCTHRERALGSGRAVAW